MDEGIFRKLTNYRGGIIGVLCSTIIYVTVYFIAFMTAFGNDTPNSRFILKVAELFFKIAYPLWYYPLAYVLGAHFIKKRTDKESSNYDGVINE